jgi:hypothetical protein
MLFVVALLVWFALSIPATLIFGRIIAAAADKGPVTSPTVAAHPTTSLVG